MVSIEVKTLGFTEARIRLGDMPKKMHSALRLAISTATKSAEAETGRQITSHYEIQKSKLREKMKITRIVPKGGDKPVGGIVVRGGRIPVKSFNVIPTDPPPQLAIPVRSRQIVSAITVKGGKGLVGRPNVFVARMASGHVGLFRRTGGSGSMPIDELFMISAAEMVSGKRCRKAIENKMREVFESETTRQIDRALGRKK